MIRSMGVVAGQERFDANTDPHTHVLCGQCGRIDDIVLNGQMNDLMAETQEHTGFQISALHFAGLCPECRKNKS